jgi:hypothetical protein
MNQNFQPQYQNQAPQQITNQNADGFPKYYRFFPFLAIALVVVLLFGLSVSVIYVTQKSSDDKQIQDYKEQILKEREYKRQLQSLLDQQLNNNTELVQAQTNLSREVENYLRSVEISFRVIDGRTELLPDADGRQIKSNQEQVLLELQSIETKLKKIKDEKDAARAERDRIFNESNQNQQNKADPRDGVRE